MRETPNQYKMNVPTRVFQGEGKLYRLTTLTPIPGKRCTDLSARQSTHDIRISRVGDAEDRAPVVLSAGGTQLAVA